MRKSPAPLVAAVLAVGCALPATPVSPAHAAPARQDRVERLVVDHVNVFRARHGLKGLRRNAALARSADQKALEVVATNALSHSSPDGTAMTTRVRRHLDAQTVGETLAVVPAQGDEVSAIVEAWTRSPTHRAQLLSASFRRVGIARRRGWVAGAPKTVVALDLASAR